MSKLVCPNCETKVRVNTAVSYPTFKCRQCKTSLALEANEEADGAIINKSRRDSGVFTVILIITLLANLYFTSSPQFNQSWVTTAVFLVLLAILVWESFSRKKVFDLIKEEKVSIVVKETVKK